jgi:glycosyltransferase involved in cell wall biosynthesis
VKLAFITPRYGAEIASGPEHGCRLLAEQLSRRHDIDVLTSCARNPQTWKNEYVEGPDRVRGVMVRRFAVNLPYDRSAFRQLSARLLREPHSRADELEWVMRLGPSSPGLMEHLKRQSQSYDALVFFSLCHATTVQGIAVAPERSVVFPYLGFDTTLRFGIWGEVLASVRAVGFFSTSEPLLLHRYIRCVPRHEEMVGIGVEPLPSQTYPRHQQDPADRTVADDGQASDSNEPLEAEHLEGRGVPFRRRHRLYGLLAVYGGRVEPDNGCEEMLEYFDSFASKDTDTTLALLGVKMMKVPEAPNVRHAGVLPDRERMAAYEAADLSIFPGRDDLLSQSLLESLAVGTPVLVSARNAAAVEHCRRAGAGLYYANREEFVEALHQLMADTRLRRTLGESGRRYVRQEYRWEPVLGRFERLITRARRGNSDRV